MQSKIRKIVFLGRKKGAVKALEFLLGAGLKISFVIADQAENNWQDFLRLSQKYGFLLEGNDQKLYQLVKNKSSILKNTDLVLSYLYWKKIRQPLINLPKLGCINFHPAPLPDYKGRAGYNTAILDQRKSYGVSAHFIDSENLDSGPIIKVLNFQINSQDSALSLYQKSQQALLKLFKQIIKSFLAGKKINLTNNKGGLYLNKQQLEELKKIDLKQDSLETINRKIKAFFFPPFHGAKITIKGEEFTLVNKELLKYLAQLITL